MPYQGPGDKNLPKNIKAMTRHARDVFVSAFNAAYEAKLRETKDQQEAESYAFAAATAAAKKAGSSGDTQVTKMKEMKFESLAPFYKAREDNGKMIVSMLASSDTKDSGKEKVDITFIDKMKEQSVAGEVSFFETHQDAIPMGKSIGFIDGSVVWEEAVKRGVKASGPEFLFVPEFELAADHPLSPKLFNMLMAGECDFQCSIGGKAVGEKVWDKESMGTVQVLKPGSIDHVALTRKGKAANPDAMMFGAVMKSTDWAEVAEPEKEETAAPEEKPAEEVAKEEAAPVEETAKEEKTESPDIAEALKTTASTIDAVVAHLEAQAVTPEKVAEIVRQVMEEEKAKAAAPTPEEKPAEMEPVSEPEKPVPSETPEVLTEKVGKKISNATSSEIKAALAAFSEAGKRLQALVVPEGDSETAEGDPPSEGDSTAKTAEDKPVETKPEDEVTVLKAQVAILTQEIETIKKQPASALPVAGVTEVEKTIEPSAAVGEPDEFDKALSEVKEVAKSGTSQARAVALEKAKKAFADKFILNLPNM